MATFKALIFEHHKKPYNVKIRVTHNRVSAYISTEYHVTERHLTKSLDIKDRFLNKRLNDLIDNYHDEIIKMGNRVSSYTAKELADYLEKKNFDGTDNDIDFISFSLKFIETKTDNYASSFKTAIYSLTDFFKRDKVMITEITSKMLERYEAYLLTERKVKRTDRNGILKEQVLKPVGRTAVFNYTTNIRTLFNEAKSVYNEEDSGDIRIRHYPFKKYKIKQPPPTKKRSLEIEVIKSIRDMADINYTGTHGTNRAALGRDVFMLSFYLIGINAVDLFEINQYKGGRLSYNRSKTSGRRADSAFISLMAEPEAIPLIEKYRDKTGKRVFCFYQMYANIEGFNKAINKGLYRVSKELGLDEKVTEYYARHSWATIARNECGISKDDIDEALNHVNPNHKVVDIYIKKDWSIIDEANRKVLDKLKDT